VSRDREYVTLIVKQSTKPGVLRRFRPQMTEAITCRGENRGATMRFVEDAA
jgi:hypothetical protein